MQLPVYQLAVRQAGGAEHRRGRASTGSSRDAAGSRDLPLPDDEPATLARLRELVGARGRLIDAGMFPRTTAGTLRVLRRDVCLRISAWARARKRRHEALAPVVRLQGPQDDGAGDDS